MDKNFKFHPDRIGTDFKLGFGIFILCILCCSGFFYAEEFTYDSHGRKDPFSPPVISAGQKADIELLTGVELEGIIWDELSPIAIVNDKVVNIGDEVAGAKIVEITENEVVFEVNGQKVKLRLRIIEEGGL